jgi:prevent-host-death family protein
MSSIPSADAKARFSELVDRADAGEPVITHPGEPVAHLRALTDRMEPSATAAADLVRAMRDDDRY